MRFRRYSTYSGRDIERVDAVDTERVYYMSLQI